jgi:hypothetical protein
MGMPAGGFHARNGSGLWRHALVRATGVELDRTAHSRLSRLCKIPRRRFPSVADMTTYIHKATCRFTVSSWEEEVYADIDGTGAAHRGSGDMHHPDRGLSRAQVSYCYTGDLEGTSTLVYLLGYRGGDDLVMGLERFEGSVAGHEGSFVLRHEAVHDSASVHGRVTVVPGMGTGALERLRGEAELTIAGHSEEGYELVLSYDVG